MATVTLKVPRDEATTLLKSLDQKKVKYVSDGQKGFLPLEEIQIIVTVTELFVTVLVAYLEHKKEPSEIIIETPDGDLSLTANNIKKLHLNLNKKAKQ